MLALSVGNFGLMEVCEVDQVLALLALVSSNEIDFGIAEESSWFSLTFEDSLVYDLRAFENQKRFSVTLPETPV